MGREQWLPGRPHGDHRVEGVGRCRQGAPRGAPGAAGPQGRHQRGDAPLPHQAERFLFFPTYEHQRADLLQPEFQDDLTAVLAEPRDPSPVRFDTWAELTDLFEITEPAQVEALAPFYCFSTAVRRGAPALEAAPPAAGDGRPGVPAGAAARGCRRGPSSAAANRG